MRKLRFTVYAFLTTLALSALPASAQATRTWVSGVGDDANPCSRTAPCKTFAGAISKTAAGGEINVLDPGGFGGVTITKSISIESDGAIAGVLVSGTNAIIINAGVNDVIVLRGLIIDGVGTGLNGIRFLAGGSLHVENCTINNFVQKGIDFEPSGNSRLFVSNTVIRNNANAANGGGILVKPGVAGSATASIENVRLERNLFGVRVEDRAKLTAKNSSATNNSFAGFSSFSTSAAAFLVLDHCVAANNGGFGIKASGALAAIRLTNCTLTANPEGIVSESGGDIISWGNNYNDGNTTNNGVPTLTINPQ